MVRLIPLLLLALPLLEIAVFILVGQRIGVWMTLLAIVLTTLAGGILVRIQGRNLVADIRATMNAGGVPARAATDALMIGVAGLLLLIPGFITDIVGLALLVPPVRGLIYRWLASRVRVVSTAAGYRTGSDPLLKRGPTVDLDDEDWRPR